MKKFLTFVVGISLIAFTLPVLASSAKDYNYNFFATNNPHLLIANGAPVGQYAINIKSLGGKISCNGGSCPSTINSYQVITYKLASSNFIPMMNISFTSPLYKTHLGICSLTYTYLIIGLSQSSLNISGVPTAKSLFLGSSQSCVNK